MIKTILFSCLICLVSLSVSALNITIIESQSMNSGHNMDQVWLDVVTGMGHTAAIFPQTTLDDTNFFATTDILIVASGVIVLPANRVQTILQFLQNRGSVYLNTEYDTSFSPNQAFSYLVNTLGGSFQWRGTVAGTLIPMTVVGSLNNVSNNVPALVDDFWYGASATGCNGVEPFLLYNGYYLGYIYCTPAGTRISTTTDQDWIRGATPNDKLLLENIITNLSLSSYACAAWPMFITVNGLVLTSSVSSSYQWYTNGGPIAGANSQSYTATQTGYYHVCTTDFDQCKICSDSVFISTTGLTSVPHSGYFNVYPNPADGRITIECKTEMSNGTIAVFAATGQLVYKTLLTTPGMQELDLNVPDGIYILKIESEESTFIQRLLIK
jgi:hypothetical protein